MQTQASNYYSEYIKRLSAALEGIDRDAVGAMAEAIFKAYEEGRQLFVLGNGGSAATASHMVCDLSKTIFGSAGKARRRFRVLSLTDNVPMVTALANDVSYNDIFADQLRTYANPGDLVIVISGSGNSPNIVAGIRTAKEIGLKTVGLLGFGGGKCKGLVDIAVVVPSSRYGPVEDAHMVLDHFVTEFLQTKLAAQ